MRATTIRFPNDLWDQLERDAALYRVAFSAGAASEEDAKRDPNLRSHATRFRR
jgi:hypothetical protein